MPLLMTYSTIPTKGPELETTKIRSISSLPNYVHDQPSSNLRTTHSAMVILWLLVCHWVIGIISESTAKYLSTGHPSRSHDHDVENLQWDVSTRYVRTAGQGVFTSSCPYFRTFSPRTTDAQ